MLSPPNARTDVPACRQVPGPSGRYNWAPTALGGGLLHKLPPLCELAAGDTHSNACFSGPRSALAPEVPLPVHVSQWTHRTEADSRTQRAGRRFSGGQGLDENQPAVTASSRGTHGGLQSLVSKRAVTVGVRRALNQSGGPLPAWRARLTTAPHAGRDVILNGNYEGSRTFELKKLVPYRPIR